MTDTERPIYTVSELNESARELLENYFSHIWIEGEVSNLSCPSSGHWYFSIKDAKAQIRCAMFRNQNYACKTKPKEGDHVLLRATVSLYEGRGDYQLIVESLQYTGDGALQKAFEQLKTKLDAQGLFARSHKKSIPTLPRCIGVITSPTGAAIRDVLSVLKRRMPSIPVIIYPCSVQGQLAAGEIVHALNTANTRQECDVLLLVRGGGSLEDLWPFNEELVARAIFNSKTPIVSGVGHEIDFTIADFVADHRAPTPSAAAESVSASSADLQKRLTVYQQQLWQIFRHQLKTLEQRIAYLRQGLETKHPQQRLLQQTLQLDHLEQGLRHHLQNKLSQLNADLQQKNQALQQYSPLELFHGKTIAVRDYEQKLQSTIQQCLQKRQDQLAQLATTLDAISPLGTLKRGYVIARNERSEVVHARGQVSVGDRLNLNVADGLIGCTVDQIS